MADTDVSRAIRIRESGPTTGTPVVLLHGLARTSRSMRPLAAYLAAAGYRVLNTGYPSRHWPIGALADALRQRLIDESQRFRNPLSWVTHSLGGILLRYLAADTPPTALGRAVMLAPPNSGSEVVDAIGHSTFFRWINGPAGQELGTAYTSTPNCLGPAPFNCGIIAGDRCRDPVCGRYPPLPSDGKVAVPRTYLTGMADHIRVPTGHTTIMGHRTVRYQTAYFLAHGRFHRPPPTPG